MQVVMPSRGRPQNIPKVTKLFPDAVICVGEDEAERYSKHTDNLLVHPENVTGIGPLRQWILDNVKDETVLMVDDDVYSIYSLCGFSKWKIHDPDSIRRILEVTALCAKDAGARVFGFNQSWDVRKFNHTKPFILRTWVGGVIGIIGRELRYDPSLHLRADIDFCLESIKRHKIIWMENRYSFVHRRFVGQGGNAVSRSKERNDHEIAYLQAKWKRHLQVRDTRTTTRLVLDI